MFGQLSLSLYLSSSFFEKGLNKTQTTTINKEEEPMELLEKEETPQEEYSRHLEEIKKEASSDKSTYHQVFRISPESLALIYMSDNNKKYLIN